MILLFEYDWVVNEETGMVEKVHKYDGKKNQKPIEVEVQKSDLEQNKVSPLKCPNG